jgi:hypothetical protein
MTDIKQGILSNITKRLRRNGDIQGAAVPAPTDASVVGLTESTQTLDCRDKYNTAIEKLISSNDELKIILKNHLGEDNDEFLEYLKNVKLANIANIANIDSESNTGIFKTMAEDIKYLLRTDLDEIKNEINKKYTDYSVENLSLLYIHSIHLLNIIHSIAYNRYNKYENIFILQYKYHYLMCVNLRKGNDEGYYNFIKGDDDNFTYIKNIHLKSTQQESTPAAPATGGGKKLLSVNKIKEIADKLKVSHSKCKSKESIMSKIKSIDLQKLTIEQLKIYCKLFNIRGCSKCKSKKSLLLHTKSNMKVR